ncbi:hypothetical protein [Massilia consociata]|uniref:Uncharacterized protein n=1 Tax=Massilia consociata TaxID=760117 RepID=A0ABV6FEG1_9BURK
MSNLERKWWFVAAMAGGSTFCSLLLLGMAGIGALRGPAQWMLHFFCLIGFWRCFSFLAWFAVLLVAPSSPLLDRYQGPGRRRTAP